MAIIIPSKNIYGDTENPKVRDNVIERIEVEAVEVVPDNDYETPVYNEKIVVDETKLQIQETTNENLSSPSNGTSGGGYESKHISVAYVAYNNQKTYSITIYIPVVSNNHYLSEILLQKENEDNKFESNIHYTLYGFKTTGNATATWSLSSYSNRFTVEKGSINYGSSTSKTQETVLIIPSEISLKEETYTPTTIASASAKLLNVGTISTISQAEPIYIDGKEYYKISGTVMCGIRTVSIKGANGWNDASGQPIPTTISLSGQYEIYEPTQIEITIYGNTIGIDLQDKTLYVNGSTQKKVHSVSGNELMQTSNFYSENQGVTKQNNYLEYLYGETQKSFKNGKETATIRCSISDYYDGDKKVISIDNSTGKMSFNEGDQVIPMVYGADGKDRPMSLYQNRSPKVFTVLGAKKYYNGAVWQELYLQET